MLLPTCSRPLNDAETFLLNPASWDFSLFVAFWDVRLELRRGRTQRNDCFA